MLTTQYADECIEPEHWRDQFAKNVTLANTMAPASLNLLICTISVTGYSHTNGAYFVSRTQISANAGFTKM